jgi:hypothetical protein
MTVMNMCLLLTVVERGKTSLKKVIFCVVTPCRFIGREQGISGEFVESIFSEMLVFTYQSAWCHNLDEQHRHPHHRENSSVRSVKKFLSRVVMSVIDF